MEVRNIDWILTVTTEKFFKAELCKQAAKDAMRKARDYCDVLGCTNVRPVELREGDARAAMHTGGGGLFGGGRNRDSGGGGAAAGMFAQTPGHTLQQARMANVPSGGHVRDEDLGFDAQEVKMAVEVTVKFQADHVGA